MFSHRSRYYGLADKVFVGEDGREYVYKARRFPPLQSDEIIASFVRPKPNERLDQVAVQTLGDPTLFWRLADANDALDPSTLTDSSDPIAVPAPRMKTP